MDLRMLITVSLVVVSGQFLIWDAAAGPQASDAWAGAVLSDRTSQDLPAPPSLEVVRQGYLSRPGIRKSVMQTPLQIQDKRYGRGLGTYATSEIIVRLPKPGRTFQAEIGIDNNFETKGRLGTAIFIMEVSGKEVLRSDIRRGSDPPLPVKIDLKGTKEFILRVLDAGDGPEYDQADWVDASVTLEDDRKIWLDESSVVFAPGRFSADIPFSFVYDGRPSSELLPHWKRNSSKSDLPSGRQRHVVTFTDPVTGLEIRCESTLFEGFPAVDWVVYLRNTGTTDTPLVENIRAMDLQVAAPPAGDIVLHHSHGSTAKATDFLPIDDIVAPNTEIKLTAKNGRSSDTTLPFFNLEWPGGGVVGAVGWSGQWSMHISRGGGSELTLQAGQQTTHLILHPGEMIRTPRMLLLAWRGSDPIHGHNLFRRLLVTHYLPRVNGEVVLPPVTQNTWVTYSANGVTEENQLDVIRTAAAIGVECYWLDAGWFEGGWSQGAGSWVPKREAFPNGLRPLGDAAHKKRMKFVLWFEPERVCPGSRIDREHSDWVMHVGPGEEITDAPERQSLNENKLFKLGDQAARKWMTDLLSKCIKDWSEWTSAPSPALRSCPFRIPAVGQSSECRESSISPPWTNRSSMPRSTI
ncbi:MAG: NPCBM/NEW2 domain-containing protein [Chloroflexi bacterium]|nr:NPCBM/NEW2 domain-containing protein [Chloroflexota bacterium]